MANQQNIQLVRRLFEEVYSKANAYDKLREYYAEDIKFHDKASKSESGLKNMIALEEKYSRAFPDKKAKVEQLFASDDGKTVTAVWTMEGTHKGQLDDIDATNKHVKIHGISVYSISHGKISEIYQTWDRLGLLEQIGEIQPSLALHG